MNNIKLHIKFTGILFLFLMYSCNEDTIEEGQTGTLTGNVVSMGDNLPLANVKITTQPSSSTVFTDELGEFIIEDILVQQYSVQAEKEEYLVDFESTNVLANKTVNVVFELQISTANNKPPAKPILIAPEMNTEDAPLSVEFIWNSSDDPDDDELTYKLTLRNDQNNTVEIFEQLTDTVLTVSTLTFSTKYFWNVSVSDDINEAVISETSNFKTLSTPENDYLVVQKIESNNVIYSSKEDGSLLQLTSESTNSWRPRKNTTTHKIAYLQSVGGETHLFTMNEDGSNKVQITQSIPVSGFNLDEIDFAWKPTGEILIYPNFNKIYQINADGSGVSEFYKSTNGNFITEIDWSENNDIIAVKTNNNEGYNVEIFTMDTSGTIIDMVLSGVSGAAGGLNLNVDGTKLLYSYDVSGSELPSYNIQESRLFIYNSGSNNSTRINTDTNFGYNDLDPRFSPNEDSVIYTYQGKALNSRKYIYKHSINEALNSTLLFSDMSMADWEL